MKFNSLIWYETEDDENKTYKASKKIEFDDFPVLSFEYYVYTKNGIYYECSICNEETDNVHEFGSSYTTFEEAMSVCEAHYQSMMNTIIKAIVNRF